MKKFHAKLFQSINELLLNSDVIDLYRDNDKAFVRNRKLPFQKVVHIILQLLKSSVKSELKTLFSTLNSTDEVVNWVTDGAFCKARQKIKHSIFIDLYKAVVSLFYSCIKGERWLGHRLMAVDGSCINLPSSDELRMHFGTHHINSIGTEIPQARVSYMYDVLNSITIDAQIESDKIGEQEMLSSHLNLLDKNDLLTADSNYGHFRFIKEIASSEAGYCIRLSQSSNFIKSFLASGEKDAVLEWHPSYGTKTNCLANKIDPSPFTIRLVRVDLSDDEVEVLGVSLLDQNRYDYQSIMELYNLRWGVEEEFKKTMQRLQIEFFSSLKLNGLLQDFFANIFMQNIVSVLIEPVKGEITEASKNLKYARKANWTSALTDVRKRLVLLFMRGKDQVDRILISLWESFKTNTEPIRPGRKFRRDKRKKGSGRKAFMQYKPAM